MEPADIMKITMSVEDAQKILPDGTPEGIVPTCISTHIRGKKTHASPGAGCACTGVERTTKQSHALLFRIWIPDLIDC